MYISLLTYCGISIKSLTFYYNFDKFIFSNIVNKKINHACGLPKIYIWWEG